MLCDRCKKNEAYIHLTRCEDEKPVDQTITEEPCVAVRHHFCESCADEYYLANEMPSWRNLITVTDFYLGRLYDKLEQLHPEVFDEYWAETGRIDITAIMSSLLEDELKKEGLALNELGFDMLLRTFVGNHEFYTRADKYKKNGE